LALACGAGYLAMRRQQLRAAGAPLGARARQNDEDRHEGTGEGPIASVSLPTPLRVLVSYGCFMASANFTIMMPTSAGTVRRLGGDTALSGVVIASYGVGCLLSLPPMLKLSRSSYKLGMVLAAVCAVGGNMLSIGSLELGHSTSNWFCVLSRVVCGMEGGVAIVLSNIVFRCSSGRGTAQSMTEGCVSMAMGFTLGPWISSLTLLSHWGLKPETLPALAMVGLGAVYGALALCLCPEQARGPGGTDPGRRAAVEGRGEEAVCAAWVNLWLQAWTNLVRFSQRIAWEAGALVLLVDAYGLSTEFAAFLVGAAPLCLVPFVLVVAPLLEHWGLVGFLHRMEAVQIAGVALMLVREHSLWSFMVGSALFYPANWVHGLLISTVRSQFDVPGHWMLELESSTGYLWAFTYLGFFVGPIVSRTLLQACLSQRALAVSLGAMLIGLAVGQEVTLRALEVSKPRSKG